MSTMSEIFGDPISTYSRAQAIEDGVLVDVSATAREAGLRFPVALTRAVWEAYVVVPTTAKGPVPCQDERGRLWDVVSMLRFAVMRGQGGAEVRYSLIVRTAKGRRRVTLKALCGPGDEAEPVITVMLPDED